MAQVRGMTLFAALNDIRKTYGEETFARIQAALKPESAKVIGAGLTRTGWYPFEVYIDFCRQANLVLANGDYRHARDISARAAEADMGTFLKFVLMVFSTPSDLVAKLPSIWGKYFDAGEMVVTVDQPGRIVLELREFPTPDALHCEILAGWLERFVQLALKRKGKKVACTHPKCRTAGAPVCEFALDLDA